MNATHLSPPTSETQRLFFALWPPSEISQQLYHVAGKTPRANDGRRVVPENVHMTLAFLGQVDESFRQCAEQAASAIRGESFTLILRQMGCWLKSGILWVGPAQVPEALLQLVQALNAGLSTCGYVPDKRPYAAHATLARKVHRCLQTHPIKPLIWEVHRFCLVQSHTRAEGARYEILRTWELNSPVA